ncbi:MAG: carboxypeptidase-like regulatory domain-containing protein [Pyrinomonadaceae bacterium]|nr:carboxypeptidase-like regulatory domain-containing protein [Sphingobacteriaceae bacterium]
MLRTKNMLVRLVLFMFICNAQVLWAQQVMLYGKVVNDSLQPVKYVSIGIANTSIGTVSDESGAYTIRFNQDSVSVNDSLKFSIIGYQSRCLPLFPLKDTKKDAPLVTVLKNRIFELPQVLITSEKRIIRTKGTHGKSLMNLHVNFALSKYPNQNLGSEIGRRFGITKKNTKIEALRFYISHNNFDNLKLRINVYSIKSGKPFRNLLTQNIYIDIKNRRKGWIESDLTEYGIILNEDVIVSLEWISKSSKGTILNIPIVMPTPHAHFYKYASQDRWKRFNAMSTYMELIVSVLL